MFCIGSLAGQGYASADAELEVGQGWEGQGREGQGRMSLPAGCTAGRRAGQGRAGQFVLQHAQLKVRQSRAGQGRAGTFFCSMHRQKQPPARLHRSMFCPRKELTSILLVWICRYQAGIIDQDTFLFRLEALGGAAEGTPYVTSCCQCTQPIY